MYNTATYNEIVYNGVVEAVKLYLDPAGKFTQIADTYKGLYYNTDKGLITTASSGNKVLDIDKDTGRLTAT